MISLKCPVCRGELDPPIKIKKLVEDNGKQYEAENAENGVFDIIGEITKLPELTPEEETKLALDYIQKLIFPRKNLSGKIELEIILKKGDDVFSRIVTEVIGAIRRSLEKGINPEIIVRVKEEGAKSSKI